MALLTDKTRELLANRPRHITYRTIADDTSQSLPKSDQIEPDWLRRFAAGLAKQPSCDRVQILYEYLTGGPLIQ